MTTFYKDNVRVAEYDEHLELPYGEWILGGMRWGGVLFAAILLASCGPPPTRQEQAIQAAYSEARTRFQYSEDIHNPPPIVEDLGDRWRIYLPGSPASTGGDPTVMVRKSDLSVLDSYSGQ